MRRIVEIAVSVALLGGCTALNGGPPTGQGGGLPSGTGTGAGFGAGGLGGSLGHGGGSGPGGSPGSGGLGPAPASGGTVGAAGAPGSGGTVASGGTAGARPGSGGAGGTIAAGGRPGSGGATGSGGVTGSGGATGSGGYSGAGTAIIPDATGHVVGTTNAFGITGAWYSYSDGVGTDGTTPTGNCEVAKHDVSQCSTVTSPAAGTAFANTGGKMCTSGTAARTVDIVGMTGMPDYRNIWGAAIALDLNYSGTKGTFSATSNASGKTVTGLSFDISFTTAPTGEGLRVEFPTPSTDGSTDGSAYWGADQFFSPSPVTAAGTYKVYFADVRGPGGVAFDQTKIESIAFHVPSNSTNATPFNFCVSNLTVLTDNGGGCPPPLAGGTCNLPACGCVSGQVCYPSTTTMNLACFTSTNLGEGADCRNATCPSGLGCFGGVCKKYCHSDLDCPQINGARSCGQTTWSTTMTTIPGVEVCQHICDPVSPQSPHSPLLSCPAGFACAPDTKSPGLSFCEARTGTGAAGSTCATDDDCTPGNFCAANGTLCWHFCYSNADCPSTSTCAAFASTPNYAGTSAIGYCTM